MSDVQVKSIKTFTGLEWLVGEIENSLNAAFNELETFTQNTGDETKIRFCIGHLHQINGPFKILECEGCILLVEEMEALTQAIIDKKVSNINEACEILVQAIVKLPIYLRQLLSTREDRPETLIRLLNDLRAAQGRALVSEGILFAPDLSAFEQAVENRIKVDSNPATADLIRRLRQVYQLSLIKVIKQQDQAANFANLKKVLQRMREISKGSWQEKLWHIAGQALSLTAAGEIGFSIALKKLFRALDSQLKNQANDIASGEPGTPDIGLLKNLLYYLTTSKPGTEPLQTIWREYKLADAFPSGTIDPDHGRLIPQYDSLVVRSLVAAIQGELATVRSALERFSLEGGLSADEVRESLPIVANMADSLALVGQRKLRDAASRLDKKLRAIFSVEGSSPAKGSGINDEAVAEAVQDLAEIELALNTWAASPDKFSGTVDLDRQQNQFEFDSASQALLAESRTGIERIKEAVVAFINSHWDMQLLTQVPGMFKELQGALRIIGLTRAASVVAGCAEYVENMIAEEQQQVEWRALDTFADAITIVEYYLEQFHVDTGAQQEDVLKAAEESIHALLQETDTLHSTPSFKAQDDQLRAQPEEIIEELVSLEEQQESAAPTETAEAEKETAERGAEVIPISDPSAQREMPKADAEEFVDDEIIEIFVEEADEVLEALTGLLPEWRNQLQDKELLAVARRSFHTLKGSGRMVGAANIGELAWSVEDMFNHVIDGRVSCNEMMVDLSEHAIASLAEMIADFSGRQPIEESEQATVVAAAIIGTAERLASGEILDQLPAELVEQVANSEELAGRFDEEIAEQIEEQSPSDVSKELPEETQVAEATTENIEELNAQSDGSDLLAEEIDQVQHDGQDNAEGQEDHEAILLDIFVTEAQSHLKTIDEFVSKTRSAAPLYKTPPLALQRALHTLKGTAEMADFSQLSRLVAPLEEFIKELHHHHICVDDDIVDLVADATRFFRAILSRMTEGESAELDGLPMFRARLAELREKAVGHLLRGAASDLNGKDFSAVKQLMAQGLLSLQNYPDLYDYLQRRTAPPRVIFNEFLTDLDAIQNLEADIEPILQLAELMARIYRLLSQSGLFPERATIDTLKRNHENLLNLFDMLAADQELNPLLEDDKNSLLAIVDQLTAQLAERAGSVEALEEEPSARIKEPSARIKEPLAEVEEPSAEVEELSDEHKELSDEHKEPSAEVEEPSAKHKEPSAESENPELESEPALEPELELEPESLAEDTAEPPEELEGAGPGLTYAIEPAQTDNEIPHSEPPAAKTESIPMVDTELDPEIVAVFVEEADDIVSHIEELTLAWRSTPKELELADRVKRDLHTLKGGARMAGFRALGDQAHAIESLIDETKVYNKRFFKIILAQQEKLISTYDIVRQMAAGGDIKKLSQQLVDIEGHDDIIPEDETQSDSVASFIKSLTAPTESGPEALERQPAIEQSAFKGEIKEVVRIGAEVLDTLVNLSGENIIFRGRVEEQLSEFNQFLDEMDATIDRLQSQVRRLGTETEAQIDYRREQIEASGQQANFDPLEMDRYSQLQQLTGSLMESASDLRDLKETLNDRLNSTESLLLHQSRINTDLQEGLMKTRMVPFARIVPRLRRITRQLGIELKKDVDLRMDNIHGEMDRSVLDRMVAPLEHMIRNSIDHGIESAEERLKIGKPASGNIVITTYRQGGDIVIKLADDGRGLDVEKIRRRALEKDLIAEDAALSAHEIAQFIFHPGFTTSDSISQISGRGVGMDVVSSEVRQCGGRVEIDTSAGHGTQFTIILPFTLSVNRALMINVTGDLYALSLNSIYGVHFMPQAVVDEAINSSGVISYANMDYELCYLGTLLNPEISKRPDSLGSDAALVLFHSDNRRFAVQVDEVIGTREIVVKTLGSQFSIVPGLGGATILSDGQVVVIIDLNELARVAIVDLPKVGQENQSGLTLDARSALSNESSPNILVVDDSVTVRKVTSRVLRRQGYRVATAKDGVEALKAMQEEIPAVILLDIEMPRMDGFEVATRVRASEELRNIPIIMITSRTGDKHRQRAMELGVDYYMGKPYQEEQLLETLDQLLTAQN